MENSHRCTGVACRKCREPMVMTWTNMLVNIRRLVEGQAWFARVKTIPAA